VNKQVKYVLLLLALLLQQYTAGQEPATESSAGAVTELFLTDDVLPIRISYSQRDIKKITNDSTYIDTELMYQYGDGNWDTLAVKARVRGNNRLKNCYFPPIKLKIKKSAAKGTLFEGNKKLKLVMPCLLQRENNDLVLKEFLGYKLFEIVSPYHYETRLVDIDFKEEKGKNIKEHKLRGILIEDIDNVAERHHGNELKRTVHPLQQDNICSIRNDLFQYMIGNTDFSIAYQHNQKLIFVDKKTIPVPYDFDMSGLVDASYSVVSKIGDQELAITEVTQRLYRGFERTPAEYQQVRKEYLGHKNEMLAVMDRYQNDFDNPDEFRKARDFIIGYFEVLENDSKFGKEILAQARVK
jgi:hypothetical protein